LGNVELKKEPLIENTTVGIDNRISIPRRFSDRLGWIKGIAETEAWLFIIEPGRHRLLSEEDVHNDPKLNPIRLLITQETPSTATEASYAEPLKDAASVARLFPITLKFHTAGWRIPFEHEWAALAPPDSNPKDISFLFGPEGFLELWFTDVLRQALTSSWKSPR
jgi:hypothetical protein